MWNGDRVWLEKALIVVTGVIWLGDPLTVIKPGWVVLMLSGAIALNLDVEAH